ncbi:MAG: methyltransferase domain-containing protein [Burkholderiaceae bacterium]|jgi:GT2 family glycosyltransferase/2-polyprenyl-3-methyl-5-hydroxy-6-metoxy-1,4-benzoquinol methylase/glycosyltransferase involved in cell wall biosynthesis|nr:methyltransferase domain-containing protein [Burkholderiaceae bacterium]
MSSPAQTSASSHVYERDIDGGERTSLALLAARIAPGARVLDLGCGSGAVGRFLARRDGLDAPIDGLTISQEEAERARPHYRRVEVADLDQADLTQLFERGAYDAIICADVLEHVRQPPRVLRACRELLAPGGAALLSLPNVGYCGLIAELMAGEFRYREEGLLDASHVHFFTRATLLRLLFESGWGVELLDTIRRELPDSEFRAAFDALPPAVARYLLALPDALAYQFIVTARPGAQNAAAPPVAADDSLPARALFSAELFLGGDAAHVRYNEARKLTVRGEIGNKRQTLRFELPPAPPLTGLKLDLADRPGFIHLYDMQLADSAGRLLWRWISGDPVLTRAPHHDLAFAEPKAGGVCMALMHGNDPWIELPIPPQALAQAAGGVLSVELGWPMSADYLALAHLVRQRADDLPQEPLQDLAVIREQNEQQLRRQQLELIVLRRERDAARAMVRTIEATRIFRTTRPIVRAKLRIQHELEQLRQALSRRAEGEAASRPPALVDVIVPVYRGLQDTRRCVESALRAPCQMPWRLVLINDASPEPELAQWLRQIAAADPRITLLENEQNLGFVATVNRGMALAPENDVLLLNSDTEVAPGWLDRLRAAAYSDEKVATVTPFSNNATICSYPRFCQDNELPAGWDTARLDALFARLNARQTVDVPTGVGFCMYVRRAALAEMGLFDAEIFGKGYGEENDFCIRARQAGWRNLHALDVFVRHLGGVSFGAAKAQGERDALDALRRLHPYYEGEVQRFIQADPARPARLAADAARLREDGLPVILAVLHHRLGGTERHVLELARLLRGKARFLALRPMPDHQVSLRLAQDNEDFDWRFPLRGADGEEHSDGYAALLALLRAFGVCHVHYHHRIDHDPAILDLARQLGVRYDFTAHDYYAICPQITLTGSSGGYCGEHGLEQCTACLQVTPVPECADIAQWRGENAAFIHQARFVIAPSSDALARLLRYTDAAPLRRIAHTDLDPEQPLSVPRPLRLEGERPLKVAVVGALSAAKGADVLAEAARAAKATGAPVEFHLIGYSHRPQLLWPHARLTIHGRYAEADLPALLARLQPDVVWFPAQWPETYCYVLSACLQGGWPIAASAIGAFPERLAGRGWTWLKPWNTTVTEWLDFFAEIRQQHYRTGHPPAPPMPALPELPASAQLGLRSRQWYAGPYLAFGVER